VVERCFTAQLDDAHAAAELARGCQVVTLEIEKVSLAAMEAVQNYAPMRPGPHVLAVVQDRARQKAWLKKNGFPLGDYREAKDAGELAAAVRALGGHVFAKATQGGYDGKGQVVLRDAGQAAKAWEELGKAPMVVEQRLDLEAEISVMVARRPSGEMAVYPPALNHHEDRILAWSVLPAPMPEKRAREAAELARTIAEKIDVHGLLAVEMFLTKSGQLLVNELAPRPHNSFHATEVGCSTSQFEQAVRAVCDLPLGSTDVLRPAAICNLLGDLWLQHPRPAFDAALALPGVRLHLYGKRVARPGRKMGHLSATGASAQEAVERVQKARALLG
jgi:5-(carboxyamino)imidazole ribonucleotide synthase